MNKKKLLLPALLLSTLFFTSCETTESIINTEPDPIVPTAAEFAALQTQALDNITQEFTFTNDPAGWMTFTSESGVTISFFGGCLTDSSGTSVTGDVTLEFVELFNSGSMVATGMPTMGVLPDSDLAMLISGGEFYINATQDGDQLELTCAMQLTIPTALTGGADNDMTLWNGIIDDNGNIVWEEEDNDNPNQEEGGVFIEGGAYYAFFGSFGWTNVDRFYSDPRPKTTINVAVPEGFDNENSAVYISYNEEGNALARLDTYDDVTGYFSEHYGQIPVGLECHVIFASESDGGWLYAIKAVTIEENGVITFTEAELDTVTEAELIALINALP